MDHLPQATQWILRHPFAFLRRALGSFAQNQGLLLAGAVAYYALLSLIPLLILAVIAVSRWLDQAAILAALGRYLEWLVPSQSQAVLSDVAAFIDNRTIIGIVLLLTMIFFSSLAFSVLGKALAVIFPTRKASPRMRLLASVLVPYGVVLLLGMTLLGITVITIALRAAAQDVFHLWGLELTLRGIAGPLLYLAGIASEIAILTVLYLLLPPGRTRLPHALLGACAATFCWDVARHGMVWYFTKVSQASVVYGSLTTAVVVLFSMEIIATLFLFGAQLIAEYEEIEAESTR